MKSWHRRVTGAVVSAVLVFLATPPLAQTPAPSPAATAPAVKAPVLNAPAVNAPTVNAPTVNAPAANAPEPPAAQAAPAEAPPLRVELPAARPLQESAPAVRTPRDLSPWSMFLNADIVVKAAMVSLAFASLVTWTIFFAKSLQLSRARLRLRNALVRIAEAHTLSEAHTILGGRHSPVTALVRIMNSFIGISKAQTTNLAVVAPGIAEALLATAIGLVAAIPAVIIYNHFSRATKAYLEYVGRGSGAVSRLLSRDLDRSRGRLLPRAAE